MAWLLLEALLAAVILVGMVWWTMFSGRDKGELPQTEPLDAPVAPPQADSPAPLSEPAHQSSKDAPPSKREA